MHTIITFKPTSHLDVPIPSIRDPSSTPAVLTIKANIMTRSHNNLAFVEQESLYNYMSRTETVSTKRIAERLFNYITCLYTFS